MNLIHGDCLDVMATMEPESVDAIVTDPPYGLEFMGKEWDNIGRRTGHPLDPSMQITAADPEKGNPWASERSGYGAPQKNWRCRKCGRFRFDHAERRCKCESPDWDARTREYGLVMQAWHQQWAEAAYRIAKPSAYLLAFGGTRTVHRMTVALEDAGWIIRDMLVWGYASGFPKSKASLKPAWEPIVMARKPGPLRMLAIDECRLSVTADEPNQRSGHRQHVDSVFTRSGHEQATFNQGGRWPANIVLTDPIFDGGIEGVVGGGETQVAWGKTSRGRSDNAIYGGGDGYNVAEVGQETDTYKDSGTYSRFFLIPKADRADREPVLGGLPQVRANVHPTVKPVDLMRHLVRLVTPSGGTVLDPFLGSGTTAIAAEMEGFPWIGIEREAEYVAIAEARLNGTQRGLGLGVDAPTPRAPHPAGNTTPIKRSATPGYAFTEERGTVGRWPEQKEPA